MTVILTLGTPATATWRADTLELSRPVQVAERTLAQAAGQPFTTTVAYPGPAAELLAISVPRGTRWDALVTFSN